ncbi:MAG TPA: hypothetical protein VMT89_03635, partial [Candidatus Acidoferrales bacterium]|nr:hypothetical protein [Candidatus Acidoferrales bacterium]
MVDSTITGSLAGVGFSLQCDASDLAEYARQHLNAMPAESTAPLVHARLRWHEGQPRSGLRAEAERRGLERVDRDLYVSADELLWVRVDDLRDLHLRLRWNGDELHVDGDYYHRLGNTQASDALRRIRQWPNRQQLRRRRFPTLLAYLVYYPCWFWLEQLRGMHPIHAAAAKIGDECILLAGASGIGKSTLSVGLALAPGAQLLADSFVLHRGTLISPVREPILLDSFSRTWLGSKMSELKKLDHQYGLGRCGYSLAANRWADASRATLLVFPRRSNQSYTRRISAELAHRRLSGGNLIINDLRRYWAFAAVLEQVKPCGLVAQREAELAELTRRVPCYDFGVAKGSSCEDSVATLLG